MQTGRSDRVALLALAIIVGGAVLAAVFGISGRIAAPLIEIPARGPAEGYWLPEFSSRDTYAQWIMAVLAIAGVAISLFGVLLLRETLRETARTANAAIQANETARHLGEAQVRAYVSLSGLSGSIDVEAQTIRVEASIFNAGQTPARRIHLRAHIARETNHGDHIISQASRIYDDPEDLLPGVGRPAFADTHQLYDSTDERNSLESFKAGRVAYFFEGSIRYRPVVGDYVRETTFRYRIRPGNLKSTTMLTFTRTEDGNRET